jgi:hypothetical protein
MVLAMVKFTQPFADGPYRSEPTALHAPTGTAEVACPGRPSSEAAPG